MAQDVVDTKLDHLKKYRIERMVLSPKGWKSFKVPVSLSWSIVKYEKSQTYKLPTTQGVYTFIVKPDVAGHPDCSYLLYVGQTEKQTFRKRFSQYFIEETKPTGRQHIKKMAKLWKHNLWYCYAPINNLSLIEQVEDGLIEAFVPPLNRKFKGVLGKAIKAWL
jgi:hypothetical protein